jgi:NADH pyrophosphatase NudC (nudix superfamily)/very-short-patch-repair endonuclease
MSKKSTQIETEELVLKKCKEKNYTLINSFIYIDANTTLLELLCNIDGYKWKTTYNQFINQNKGCKKCGGSLKKTQSEAEELVLNKCKEKNYTLIEPFIYIDNKKTKLHLKCNIDNHEWNVTFNNFINKNRNCSKCTKKYKPTHKEAEELVLKKCKEKNYTLIEPFIYNGAKTVLNFKCNIDNYEWCTSYNNFINNDRGCKKCSGRLKKTQIEAEELVSNKCKEKNYTLIEPFIYINNTTKLHLKCNIDNHEWFPEYNGFINCNKGCPICNDSHGESTINRILTEKNIIFKREYKFENCKYKKLLQFDFYLPEYNICIEFDGIQHFEKIEKWGGEKTLKETQIRDNIKNIFCLENNIKLIRIKYDENVLERLESLFIQQS